MNIGIIGLGRVSQIAYLAQLVKNKKINSISICDTNFELLKKISNKYNISKYYSKYQKMLENEDLDLIFLIVNRFFGENLAEKILKHKKKFVLFSEKPFALSLKRANKLVKLAQKKNKTFLVGYMKRCDDGIKILKNEINKLNLGRISSVDYNSFDGNSFDSQEKYIKYNFKKISKKKNTAELKFLNTQCHSINLLEYLFGKLNLEYSNVNLFGEGITIFKNNKNIKFVLKNKFNRNTEWYEKIKIFFEKGIIDVEIPAPFFKNRGTIISYRKFSNKKSIKINLLKKKWCFENQVEKVINYTFLKKNNSKLKLYSELCQAKSCLNEFKLVKKIFV